MDGKLTESWRLGADVGGDNLEKKVSYTLLQLFLKKRKESNDQENHEINIDIQGSIKGPDKFGNYVLSFDGKKILLDENLNDLIGLEFVGITPLNERYYVGNLGGKNVFYDTETGKIIEFVVGEGGSQAKYYGSDDLCKDEFMVHLCENSFKLYPGMSEKELHLGFASFAQEYLTYLWSKGLSNEELAKEIKEFGDGSQIILFLRGAFEYIYNGRITNYLAGKHRGLWKKIKESDILKKRYPDLYLGMVELENIRNVIISKEGEIYGYIVVKDGACYYVQANGEVLKYNNFEGPDENGVIITTQRDKETQRDKKYFVKDGFKYPRFGFDEIVGPDKNNNYLLIYNSIKYNRDIECNNKICFFSSSIGKLFSLSDEESGGNEPDIVNESFSDITGPDENGNYIVDAIRGKFLLNSRGERISDIFFTLTSHGEDGDKYKGVNFTGTYILGKNGEVLTSERNLFKF